MYEKIKERLSEAVNDIFLEMQTERGITNGDVSPLMAYELEHDISTLSSVIRLILEEQKQE